MYDTEYGNNFFNLARESIRKQENAYVRLSVSELEYQVVTEDGEIISTDSEEEAQARVDILKHGLL